MAPHFNVLDLTRPGSSSELRRGRAGDWAHYLQPPTQIHLNTRHSAIYLDLV